MLARWLPCVLAPALLLAAVGCADAQSSDRRRSESEGFALVELFTSQGCSSCPPADRVLRSLAELAEERQLPLYALSMHVDYWNSLGWADPYSAEVFTNRQRAYARAAKSTRVYTPQMVVNGDAIGFNGSNQAAATKAVGRALASPSKVRVSIDVTPLPGEQAWEVKFQALAAEEGHRLVACLVADAEPISVSRGENAGRQLRHVGVVRALEQMPLAKSDSGMLTLRWPEGQQLAEGDVSIVAFAQDQHSGAIHGAARWVGGESGQL